MVWERLGQPRPATHLFTVAGTNGKGSTTAYIGAMLKALGYRCGSYTSPHLFRYNERVEGQGDLVSDQQLVDAFAQVEAVRGTVSLTYFEFGTLAAFLLMSQAKLDFAVLEIGLGGRLDAVNILDTDCAVITTIGLDHQEFLGEDRDSIGREKAGIIRPGKPVICGDPEPPGSLLRAAALAGGAMLRIGHDYGIKADGSEFSWWYGTAQLKLPPPPMTGMHQADNVATALAALATLMPEALDAPDLLRRGLKAVRLPGRLQQCDRCPRVWLDVGHNPHAAEAVASALLALNLRPRFCVLAMLRDKDAAGVAKILDECVQDWFCAGLEGERGRTGLELEQEIVKVIGPSRVKVFAKVSHALESALEQSGPDDSILVFGSFVTTAQAAAFLAGYC